MTERDRNQSMIEPADAASSSASRDDPEPAPPTHPPEGWRDEEMESTEANRSGLTREPVGVAGDRARADDRARRNFSSDREADELGAELTRGVDAPAGDPGNTQRDRRDR